MRFTGGAKYNSVKGSTKRHSLTILPPWNGRVTLLRRRRIWRWSESAWGVPGSESEWGSFPARLGNRQVGNSGGQPVPRILRAVGILGHSFGDEAEQLVGGDDPVRVEVGLTIQAATEPVTKRRLARGPWWIGA